MWDGRCGDTRKGSKFIFSDTVYLQYVLDFTYRCQHTFMFEMSKMLFSKEFTTHSIRRSAARWPRGVERMTALLRGQADGLWADVDFNLAVLKSQSLCIKSTSNNCRFYEIYLFYMLFFKLLSLMISFVCLYCNRKFL